MDKPDFAKPERPLSSVLKTKAALWVPSIIAARNEILPLPHDRSFLCSLGCSVLASQAIDYRCVPERAFRIKAQ